MFKSSKDKGSNGNSKTSSTDSSSSNLNSSKNGGSFYPNAGITNLGNSCFLNSVVQGLAASRPLRDALADYPGAERALKRSGAVQTTATANAGATSVGAGDAAAGDGAAVSSASPAALSASDSADPARRTSAEAGAGASASNDESTGQSARHHPALPSLDSPTTPLAASHNATLIPGTPTTETSPSLQLLTEDPFPTSLPLSSALASTLVKLWSGKQSTINIKGLMKALNRKNEDWNEWDQMDAHELLRFLLDGISMEEMDLIKKLQPPPPPKTSKHKKKCGKGDRPIAEQLRRKASGTADDPIPSSSESSSGSSSDGEGALSSSEAESLLAEDPTYRLPPRGPPAPRYTPFIDTIFGGKLASVIVCEECRGVSRIEEDFLDISLPIKGDDGKVRRRDRLRKFLGSSSSLNKESERPKMAPRAPTAILNVSETEASESETGGTGGLSSAKEGGRGHSSKGSLSSYASSGGGGGAPPTRQSSGMTEEEGETADDAKVRRRKSLDPGILRSNSKRAFLGISSSTSGGGADGGSAKKRDPSPLSRAGSIRTRVSSAASGKEDAGGALSAGETSGRGEGRGGSSGIRRSKSTTLLSKPTREQQQYIQQLFAEIHNPSPSPLSHLRIAQPGGGGSGASGPGHQGHGHNGTSPSAQEADGSSLALADATSTGLYTCLMQFTSVEVLEGDNAFQCRRCWKLLHPELVAQVGRKRAAKLVQKKEHAENLKLARMEQLRAASSAVPAHARDETPRGSVSAGSDLAAARASGENAIAVNRRLLAERERQLAAAAAGLDPGTADPVQLQGRGPEITVTPNSPPGTSASEASDAGLGGFTKLHVTRSRATVDSSKSQTGDGSEVPNSSLSDLGAEADEEDRSELSDSEAAHARKGVSSSNGRGSAGHESHVSWSDQKAGTASSPPGNKDSKINKSAAVGVLAPQPPRLPPRSQRFVPRKAHKRYLISSLPPVLVLHLKRFQQTNKSSLFSSFGNLKKLDDKVTYPLYLDMAPFMAPPPLKRTEPSAVEKVLANGVKSGDESEGSSRGREKTASSKHHWFRRSSPTRENKSNCVYRLYAVIVHKGNMTSGHYIAFSYTSQKRIEDKDVGKFASSSTSSSRRSSVSSNMASPTSPDMNAPFTPSDHEAARQWIYCSDHVVRPAAVDEVLKSQAYILLYERINPAVQPAKM